MIVSSPRRWAAGVALVALVVVAGCGDEGPAPVASGQDPGSTEAPSTTTAAPGGDPGASPVEGVDAAQLLAAVEAPLPPAARRAAGPTADRVRLADGSQVWRVRIPGEVPARSARATVLVGEREVGVALTPPDLSGLVAVTPDGTGLVPGAPVSFRWEGAEAVSAGPLEVLS